MRSPRRRYLGLDRRGRSTIEHSRVSIRDRNRDRQSRALKASGARMCIPTGISARTPSANSGRRAWTTCAPSTPSSSSPSTGLAAPCVIRVADLAETQVPAGACVLDIDFRCPPPLGGSGAGPVMPACTPSPAKLYAGPGHRGRCTTPGRRRPAERRPPPTTAVEWRDDRVAANHHDGELDRGRQRRVHEFAKCPVSDDRTHGRRVQRPTHSGRSGRSNG